MVTIAFISILLGATWAVYDVSFKAFNSQISRQGVIPEVERALYEFGAALRQATSVTAAVPGPGPTPAPSMTFIADTDYNGVNETIRYTWGGTAGNPLNRVVTIGASPSTTTVVIRSVQSLSFSYYDANNNLLSSPVTAANVRRVTVDLTAKNGDESFTIRGGADLRCI